MVRPAYRHRRLHRRHLRRSHRRHPHCRGRRCSNRRTRRLRLQRSRDRREERAGRQAAVGSQPRERWVVGRRGRPGPGWRSWPWRRRRPSVALCPRSVGLRLHRPRASPHPAATCPRWSARQKSGWARKTMNCLRCSSQCRQTRRLRTPWIRQWSRDGRMGEEVRSFRRVRRRWLGVGRVEGPIASRCRRSAVDQPLAQLDCSTVPLRVRPASGLVEGRRLVQCRVNLTIREAETFQLVGAAVLVVHLRVERRARPTANLRPQQGLRRHWGLVSRLRWAPGEVPTVRVSNRGQSPEPCRYSRWADRRAPLRQPRPLSKRCLSSS
jgi:hypothetical protein